MKLAIALLMFTNPAGEVRETYAVTMPAHQCLEIKKFYDPEIEDLPRTTIRMACLFAGSQDRITGK